MKISIFLITALLLGGCESLGYYSHVSKGQLQLLWGRQDIEALIASEETADSLRQQLVKIKKLRQYSIDVLNLPDNGSYLSYKDVGRPFVVWNVFAAKELQQAAKQWCFPIAGCVSYRGYFKQALAEEYAQQLIGQGYDTYVASVPAYSTLGWFDDPSLNTFVDWPDWRLAALIFHELAHQQLYLAGDTAFSESFAKALESIAVTQWLNDSGKTEQIDSYLHQTAMGQDFSRGLLELREQLSQLYQSSLDNEYKRTKKQQLISAYQQETYQRFKQKWVTDAYDGWVNVELNNAKLVTISSYYQWQPAFESLYKQQGSWPHFYLEAKRLSGLPKEQREQRLRQLQ